MLELVFERKKFCGKMLRLAAVAASLWSSAIQAQATAQELRFTTIVNSSFGGFIKNSLGAGLDYSYGPILFGASVAADQLDNDFFQTYFVEPIENRKEAIELASAYSYSVNSYLGYRIYSSKKRKLTIKINCHRPIGVDSNLLFSSYNGIYRSLIFNLVYGRIYENFAVALWASYGQMEDVFRDSLMVGFDVQGDIGGGTTLLFSYDHRNDFEKKDYEDIEIQYVKPDKDRLNLRHGSRIYRIYKKSLLNNSHRVTLTNIFDIGKNTRLGIGAGCSLDKNSGRHWLLNLGFIMRK
ncbi:MAG: hypothetical protein LBI70_03255 [Rickettsiales bacterium]|nr:hypothetical protein [Rickettsiales bacterium]